MKELRTVTFSGTSVEQEFIKFGILLVLMGTHNILK
jgi:hypothetical protein